MTTLPINTLAFSKQAHLFALISNYAYLGKEEGEAKFEKLGFDAVLIDVNESQAYVLNNSNDVIVACRGTQPSEFKDIAADLKANMVPSSTGIGKVHYGFKTSVDNIWPMLSEILSKYGKTKTIWCTGHSLGAAMATIVAYKSQRDPSMPNPQALFTYGSPKAGNKEYIKGIESIGVQHFRFVNNADIVTAVPLWPYGHFGGMYYMNHWGNIRTLTVKQLVKDRYRGFIKGVKRGQINFFTNHDINRYCENLLKLSKGEKNPQAKI